MINQDVLTYIRGQIALGVSREAIKKSLASGGWTETDMQEAFAAIDGVKTPPPPPPPVERPPQTARPSVSAAPLVQNGMQGGLQRPVAAPLTTPAQQPQLRPVPSISTISSAPVQKRKSSSWPFLFLILVLLLVLGGVAVYFLYPEWVAEYVPFMAEEEILPPQETLNFFEETPIEENPPFEDPFATSTATTTSADAETSTATTSLQATTTISQ